MACWPDPSQQIGSLRLNATVFASGVSNSSETDPAAFEREARLLVKALDEARGRFVYFSTCSVTDPDRAETHYVRHKLRMERLIAERDEYLILRLPQVVGRTDNPHTLSNYLASGIRNAEPLRIWVKAVRCLIDVEDVARVTLHLVERRLETNAVLDLAPPENVTLLEPGLDAGGHSGQKSNHRFCGPRRWCHA